MPRMLCMQRSVGDHRARERAREEAGKRDEHPADITPPDGDDQTDDVVAVGSESPRRAA